MTMLGRIILATVLLLSVGDCKWVVSKDCGNSECPVRKLASASYVALDVERTTPLS